MTSSKVWIHGYNGRMGQTIQKLLEQEGLGLEVFGGSGRNYIKNPFQEKKEVDSAVLSHDLAKIDVIIDFSNSEGNDLLFESVSRLDQGISKKILIGSTGLSQDQLRNWKNLAKESGHAILFAPNTSLGVLILMKVSREVSQTLSKGSFDIEIVESHHRNKIDAPSGTALFLASQIARASDREVVTDRKGKRNENELGVVALRGGSVFGEHSVKFLGDYEELSFEHRAVSRELFAQGAIKLTHWMVKHANFGKHYGIEDIDLVNL